MEPGESDAAATAREVLEETAVPVQVGRLVGTVERDAPGGGVYVIRDYLCRPAAGSTVVRAGRRRRGRGLVHASTRCGR